MVAWCVDQLPTLYGRHCQTHENRYGDEILPLQRAILGELAEAPLLQRSKRWGKRSRTTSDS